MSNPENEELIIKLLKEKISPQLDVKKNTAMIFLMMKESLMEVSKTLAAKTADFDKRIHIEYKEHNPFECVLTIAEDLLVFYMQTNVFTFERSHPIWQTSYLKDNETNAYCGCISIYNFLTDSFTFKRTEDRGQLIGRMFINREEHFFMESKKQHDFLYTDFKQSLLDKNAINNVINSLIISTLNFNLFVPEYNSMQSVSVSQIEEEANRIQIQTGKRLGFRFGAETEEQIR